MLKTDPERNKSDKLTWIDIFTKIMERVVPDAVTTSIILLVIVVLIALGIGTKVNEVVDAYYRGLWMLLQFTMQMTLILVLALVLAATPAMRNMVLFVSRLPRTRLQVVTLAVLTTAFVAYLSWGLALALGPIIAIHFCKEAERKGIKVDFLFMLAILAGAGSIWQYGLSASAPLLMTTPDNFLKDHTPMMPLKTTIFSVAALTHITLFTILTIAAGFVFMPKAMRPISMFPESEKLADPAFSASEPIHRPPQTLSFAQKMERTPLVLIPLWGALAAWLYYHFIVKDLGVDLNSLITIFLLACFVFHGNVFSFTAALQRAIMSVWPVVVMYHLYAGVAGLIQFTPVGETLAELIEPYSTRYTMPVLMAIISTVVAIFIPTSGGQWVIQGLLTVKAAEAAGVTAQRGLLSLSVGDHMGNLISPFWAVVEAGIARVDFRLLFGYRLIFAIIWFVLGSLVFTFLPC